MGADQLRAWAVGCRWCGGPIPPDARADSIYCGTPHRQAAWRAQVRRVELERTAEPKRLAIADPPYIGLAGYYRGHPDYAGEVDHAELIARLAGFDGWALACSSESVAILGGMFTRAGVAARLGIWVRRPMPHPSARIVTAYEGLWFRPARGPGREPGADQLSDVLTEAPGARPRTSLPGAVIGMKPPEWCEWVFGLLGAMPGDTLEDMYPGSGMVTRAWQQWVDEIPPAEWMVNPGPD